MVLYGCMVVFLVSKPDYQRDKNEDSVATIKDQN